MEKRIGNNGRMGAVMIKWLDNLYLSKDIRGKKKIKLMNKIESGQLSFELYCIMFASNPNNLFDIINANDLLFPYYQRQELYILGLASSREAAKLLVKDMLVEVYRETGEFQVREYYQMSEQPVE